MNAKMAREAIALQKELDEQLQMLADLQARETGLLNRRTLHVKKKKK